MKANPGWHPADIFALVSKRGETLTGLSRRYGAGSDACRSALIRRNKRGEEIISAFLAIPAHELWPDRYNEDGSRKSRSDLIREFRTKNSAIASNRKANASRTKRDRAAFGQRDHDHSQGGGA